MSEPLTDEEAAEIRQSRGNLYNGLVMRLLDERERLLKAVLASEGQRMDLAAELAVKDRALERIGHALFSDVGRMRSIALEALADDTIGADVWAVVEAMDYLFQKARDSRRSSEWVGNAFRSTDWIALDRLRERGLL